MGCGCVCVKGRKTKIMQLKRVYMQCNAMQQKKLAGKAAVQESAVVSNPKSQKPKCRATQC